MNVLWLAACALFSWVVGFGLTGMAVDGPQPVESAAVVPAAALPSAYACANSTTISNIPSFRCAPPETCREGSCRVRYWSIPDQILSMCNCDDIWVDPLTPAWPAAFYFGEGRSCNIFLHSTRTANGWVWTRRCTQPVCLDLNQRCSTQVVVGGHHDQQTCACQ